MMKQFLLSAFMVFTLLPIAISQCVDLTTGPLTMGFEDTEPFDDWAIVNANGDNRTFQIYENPDNGEWGPRTGTQFMGYLWNSSVAADDWFFTPCISFLEGHDYEIRFWYANSQSASTNYPEKLELVLSTSQEVAGVFTSQDIGTITNAYPDFQESVTAYTPSADGEFYLGWHCYSDADQYVLNIDDISIIDLTAASAVEDIANSVSIGIYPNPASDLLNLRVGDAALVEDATIRIIDVAGKVLIERQLAGSQNGGYPIDVSDLSNGVYFLELVSNGVATSEKFVISK